MMTDGTDDVCEVKNITVLATRTGKIRVAFYLCDRYIETGHNAIPFCVADKKELRDDDGVYPYLIANGERT